jgi:hypothetical protein
MLKWNPGALKLYQEAAKECADNENATLILGIFQTYY